MNKPKNTILYNKVKKEADSKFKALTSAYKSMWIVREYKKQGGLYTGNKSKKKLSGLRRWLKEDWVDVKTKTKNGYEKCGRKKSSGRKYPLCRPLKRISKKTPKTLKEIPKSVLLRNIKRKKSSKRVSFK